MKYFKIKKDAQINPSQINKGNEQNPIKELTTIEQKSYINNILLHNQENYNKLMDIYDDGYGDPKEFYDCVKQILENNFNNDPTMYPVYMTEKFLPALSRELHTVYRSNKFENERTKIQQMLKYIYNIEMASYGERLVSTKKNFEEKEYDYKEENKKENKAIKKDSDETIELYYEDLEITIFDRPVPDGEYPPDYASDYTISEYVYDAPKWRVIDELYYNMLDDDTANYKDIFEKANYDTDFIDNFINDDIYGFVDKYYNELLEHFKEDAIDAAETYYTSNPDALYPFNDREE